jgi:murein DD-endopeptidase MepM/ murein hydrolase activator NlpD
LPPHKPAGSAATPSAQAPPENQTAVLSEPAPRTGGRFLWPVKGKLLSSFGPKKGGLHNDGINIAAPRGTAIVAVENGVVAYAGNELRGFGNLLLIRHADGWISAYAHNDTLLVKRGDKVTRGQPIARLGSTGSVTSPQLHFELRRGADPVDPLKYLGSQGAALSPTAAPVARQDPG